MTADAPVALVTGGSGGLGAAIVAALVDRGWHVWAGSRSGKTAAKAAFPIVMDVTDSTSVEAAVAEVVRQVGGLDAVICNAGINSSAPAEELPEMQARAILDTNLWGVIHTVRHALPHLRESRGSIVAIGSLAGMVAPPGEAYYAASKHGLRGFLESLQYEVRPQGIRVALVEPGFIHTDLAQGAAADWPKLAVYDHTRERLSEHWAKAISGGLEAQHVAARVVSLAEQADPPFRTPVGRDALWVPRLKALLPTGLFFRIAAKTFGIGDLIP